MEYAIMNNYVRTPHRNEEKWVYLEDGEHWSRNYGRSPEGVPTVAGRGHESLWAGAVIVGREL